ncbi:CoA-binding protein [Phyllobacterium sp. 1468]|uniref:CoA-binding protein n=1 Tax=Phyllobacterium sp. 1468 TaxID=2817759 RepID=UPI001AE401CA|nr:CoA-binding protein [Phyllobacterium sp. 1468]
MQEHDYYSDDYIREILSSVKTIALTGASPNETRPSFSVMRFLLLQGYHVIPVNPGQAGKTILGQQVHARLADIPEPIDMVDVFRNSSALPGVVDEALALKPLPRVVWTQLGVWDEAAARKAEAAGIQVVMNRCPAIEIPRLGMRV